MDVFGTLQVIDLAQGIAGPIAGMFFRRFWCRSRQD